VREGVFDASDPEGVGDIIQGFAASTQKNVAEVLNAPNVKSQRRAIDALVKRLTLYGVATDRILGLADGSTVVLDRKQVEAMVALL
jgi:TetR/AcrR family transcriptional regulator, cholesterol catabolism regulator